jgi:dihydroorotase
MLITNVIVCDIDKEKRLDVRVEEGVVTQIGENLEGESTIDGNGAYLLPSLVDTNIRLQDSTLNSKNIKDISQKALKGGVGHVVLNADSTPAVDNEIVLEFAKKALSDAEGAQVKLMLNSLQEDLSLSNIAILLKEGAVAPYMSTIAKNNIAIKIAQYVQMYGVTLFCKAEDNSLINSGVMLDGDVSSQLGLSGIPDLSEVLHVSRMIEIARHFKIKILFKSIASPRSISLITQAKKDGVEVSCEVSIHHLTHSDKSCENFNTVAKLDPPLACQSDVALLREALKNSQIDILTSLHQPNSPVNKEVAFYDAAYGCEALSETLPLYYTKLVKEGLISMSELVRMSVANPAKSIGVELGEIRVGQRADFTLFDPSQSTEVNNAQSLYNEEKLSGKVLMSISGEKVTQL